MVLAIMSFRVHARNLMRKERFLSGERDQCFHYRKRLWVTCHFDRMEKSCIAAQIPHWRSE